jgi:four helix bundle protein
LDFETESDFLKISDIGSEYFDLRERLLRFAVDSLKFIKTLPKGAENEVIKYQYSKSSTSVGANYEEAQSSTYKEFLVKLRIALREANESKYWLKIMDELKTGDENKRKKLLNEITTISKILGSIASKVDRKLKNKSHK